MQSRVRRGSPEAILPRTLQEKYAHLKRIIREAGSAAIAFSGGVDSTLLLKVCVDLLGDKALAVTARSETYAVRELEEAKKRASMFGGGCLMRGKNRRCRRGQDFGIHLHKI